MLPITVRSHLWIFFRWENTGKDIIKCLHPNCGATICIAFHPSLDEESRDKLSRTYLNMLVSCHNSACPFRTFSSRWSKTMHRCIQRSNNDDAMKENNNLECLVNKVSRELKNDSKTEYYVPPYFLSLSDEFLRFEDCSDDGSITRDCIDECALQIRDKLHVSSGKQEVEVSMPDEVTHFCREMYPDVDLDDILNHKGARTKVPYLLSAFGWSIGEESVWDNNEGVIVKCNMCQARARLTWTGGDSSSKKRRRIDPSSKCANLKLIESHRVYCPYMCGFSSGPGQQSDLPGWKVVLSNVLKSAAAQTCVESNS